MRRVTSILICSLMLLSVLAGCNIKTKDDVLGTTTGANASTTTQASGAVTQPAGKTQVNEIPKLKLISWNTNEPTANVIRDQLGKLGIEVEVVHNNDFSVFNQMQIAGDFDICIFPWTAVSGNGDYAVRDPFVPGGGRNYWGLDDPECNRLIDLAATLTGQEMIDTYAQWERYMVEEMTFSVPLLVSIRTWAYNNKVVDASELGGIYVSRVTPLNQLSFVDKGENETRVMYFDQVTATLTNLDPIKNTNVSSIHDGAYVKLVNIAHDNSINTKDSLAYNYAISDNGLDYYMVLRDDVFFGKVENKKAVETGERVGAEDAVFSLLRMADPESVPGHRTYNFFKPIANAEIITDISALAGLKTADGADVLAELGKGLATGISSVTGDKTKANNAGGVYQVIKLTTKTVFPQILNFLTLPSAGIVSEKQINTINTYDIATYDVDKDLAYGDDNTLTEGPDYDNHLWFSGPYCILYKNDYEIVMERNPGFKMEGSVARVKNVSFRVFSSVDSVVTSLRSGDIDFMTNIIPDSQYEIIKSNAQISILEGASAGMTVLTFNLPKEGAAVQDINFRKAILNQIDTEEMIKVYNGRRLSCYSVVSPLIGSPNVHQPNRDLAVEYLNKYLYGE